MVTNGRILKVLSSIGLVVQLPNEYRGRVSLTDLKDSFNVLLAGSGGTTCSIACRGGFEPIKDLHSMGS